MADASNATTNARWNKRWVLGISSLLGLAALFMLAACGRGGRPETVTPTVVLADETPDAVLVKGKSLYEANCQSCHGGAAGGSMMDIPPPHNASGHTWHHPDCQLIDTVLNGSGAKGEVMRKMMGASDDTPRMPAFKDKFSQEDIAAILAHIKTWWTEEQREFQVRVSQVTRC